MSMVYRYSGADPCCSAPYLWPAVLRILAGRQPPPAHLLDLGCGNGATAGFLTRHGYQVTGIDSSESGIELARATYPGCRFELASIYDDRLPGLLGSFAAIISLEVIEHCPDSFGFMQTARSLLDPGGTMVLSTPYHAYVKNLLTVAMGKFDSHFDPLWEGGHLKFFSAPKLRELLVRSGFDDVNILRVGRVPPIAKSMIAVARSRGPDLPREAVRAIDSGIAK